MGSISPTLPQNQELLHDLLHLLSQPLTTLHCALELSLTEDDQRRADEVALALEQTDRVIQAVSLMREYLDAEEGSFVAAPFPLGLAIENVLEQLSLPAEARGVQLFALGTSMGAMPVKGAWLQRALFYLMGQLLENAPAGAAVAVMLEDHDSQSIISGHCLPDASLPDDPPARPSPMTRDADTLRQVKIGIARCVVESSGASLEVYGNGAPGFTIRLPGLRSSLNEIPA
jgi:hypothetical protein